MGFFSWKTADSNESVANIHSGHENARRTVYLLQPNGAEPIAESRYNGYGVFGGVDAYAWLAKMNIDSEEVKKMDFVDDRLRMLGIELAFSGKTIKYPIKLSFSKNAQYERLAASEQCEYQGFFYPSDTQ
ncbi:hypothetical protein G6Z92_06165 [Vibrio aestuarianus subsp. cardii]|uniref:hypothetical protein n=1 Tax=Vibrio aestuarianus TaxID=28171 RepID=UPI0015C57AC6|nr:hypothetical protein [Vibrio aestuarianus]NGZ66569.1 hypothetical protein [Vibrio aestuarianus subsp. cardii]